MKKRTTRIGLGVTAMASGVGLSIYSYMTGGDLVAIGALVAFGGLCLATY